MELVSCVLGLLLFAYISQAQPAADRCDHGWTPNAYKCHKFFNDKNVTRASALQECNAYEGFLFSVLDDNDMKWLKLMLRTYPGVAYWTYLNDIPKAETTDIGTGVWKWGVAGSTVTNTTTFINWNQGPANDGMSNCAGVNMQGKLSDVPCESRQGYICEMGTTTGCLPKWILYGANCYYISDTSDEALLQTWETANTTCAQYPLEKNVPTPTLLVIDDQSEADFLHSQLRFMAVNTRLYWTDLKYTGQAWAWHTNAQATTNLIDWQVEPDNVAGIENCAVVRMNGKFSDRDCASTANFICSKHQYRIIQSTSNHGCGNWARAGQMCVTFTRKTESWPQARAYCQSFGGDLMNVDTIDKKIWLTYMTLRPDMADVYWIGLNDRSKEGKYVWADGTPTTRQTLRWSQEPNDYKGQEDCAIIQPTGQYNDISCTHRAAAICMLAGLWFCPKDGLNWALDNKICYLLTPFNDTEQLFVQQEAEEYCEGLRKFHGVEGGLLAVDTKSQHDFVKQQVMLPSNDLNPYGWWTSLNDKEVEGVWKFRSGPVTDRSLVDWRGEPSKVDGDDCGLVNYNGVYHMRNCNINISFICEKYANGVNPVQSPSQTMPSSGSTRKIPSTVACVVTSILCLMFRM